MRKRTSETIRRNKADNEDQAESWALGEFDIHEFADQAEVDDVVELEDKQ